MKRTKKDLIELIETSDTQPVYVEGLIIELEGDGTLWFKSEDGRSSAFIIKSNDGNNTEDIKIVNIESVKHAYTFIDSLMKIFGETIDRAVTIEKIVEDKFNAGKVEAYEKILLGRSITISS